VRIICCVALFLVFFLPQQVFADFENYKNDYSVTYEVIDSGITNAKFDITLTNKTNIFYASSYAIQTRFKNIENLRARNSFGELPVVVTKHENGTDIRIDFDNAISGIGQKISFEISFETPDMAQQSENTWTINIPGVKNQQKYDTFNVKVIFPEFLDRPSFVKPDTGKVLQNSISFTKKDLGKAGISVSFGDFEIYDLDLSYEINNPNLFPITKEIAIPPDTNYQKIKIVSINPQPASIEKDFDGNYLAKYKLSPFGKKKIRVKGKARVFLNPHEEVLTQSQKEKYLEPKTYWENSKPIKDLALELGSIQSIYKYVVSTLKYDSSRLSKKQVRLGAENALKTPGSSVCLEFTDLFIALSRASGVPAREINGFAFTNDPTLRPLSFAEDILHAWPEYYDKDQKQWVMVDPTWENTTEGVDYFRTFDINHITFVIKGKNSSYPISAGQYKVDDNKEQDIAIATGKDFDNPNILTIAEYTNKINSEEDNVYEKNKYYILLGGFIFASFSITIFIIIIKSRHLSFFGQKR
jgi:hypothetical protein